MKEWCIGISSKVIGERGKHFYLNDYDDCTLEKCISSSLKTAKYATDKYGIAFNNLYIWSDRDKSFRLISFTKMKWSQLIDLIRLSEYNDKNWVKGTIKRKRAIIRTSTKLNRDKTQIRMVDLGNLGDFPEVIREERYLTEVKN